MTRPTSTLAKTHLLYGYLGLSSLMFIPGIGLSAEAERPSSNDALVKQCLDAGAGLIHHEVTGIAALADPVRPFETSERAFLEIEACPVAYTPRGFSHNGRWTAMNRPGGVARLRLPCEAPPPIWLLETSLNRLEGELAAFGQPSDWVLSCRSIQILMDDPFVPGALHHYPTLAFTLVPADPRQGPNATLKVPLRAFIWEPQGIKQPDSLSEALKDPDYPGACGYGNSTKPDPSPFRISFTAFSPRSAIACGVAIATQRVEQVETRLSCLEKGNPCPPPTR